MIEIIGIKFKNTNKVYYFDPDGIKFKVGESAIVETIRGVEIGEVVIQNKLVPEDDLVSPLKSVIRKADKDDFIRAKENEKKEKEAFDICLKKIEEHQLKMKLIDVQYTFDRNKILFYFTADGRIDFRELVKSLAAIFRTRIELRQIGVRDEAKMLSGIGVCGHVLCCSSFLGDFEPVSIKMAKEQNLSLNPTKISGNCGRLMCCLKYEQETYENLLKRIPKIDAIVQTPEGRGVVVDYNVLRGTIKVKLDKAAEGVLSTFHAHEVEIIRNAEIKLSKEELDELKKLE